MIHDLAVLGIGFCGAIACFRIAEKYPKTKLIGIEIGRPPLKRRKQTEGYCGAAPSSDGKLYLNDLKYVANLTGARKVKQAHHYVQQLLSSKRNIDLVKDTLPNKSLTKNIKLHNYQIITNDHYQLIPADFHVLSRHMSTFIDTIPNLELSFDNEIKHIYKQKNHFTITTELDEFKAHRVIFCMGRSGWRQAREIFQHFGLIESDDIAKMGIRLEMNEAYLEGFNKSNCSLIHTSGLELGPFSWSGTCVPEDQLDMAISAFRGNEARWHTDKVSFNLLDNRIFPEQGTIQLERLAKLIWIICNERIYRERVANILSNKSKISIIPEYNWVRDAVRQVAEIIPELLTKAYFHVPTIIPSAPRIELSSCLETNLKGFYVAGESANIPGLLGAAVSGIIAADSACS